MPGKPPAGGSTLGLLQDKRVLIGAAVAGGVGLVVLLTRRGAGAAPAQTAPQLDSSQTDLYNALQDINSRWRSDLSGWTDQLQDVLDRLPARPSGGTGAQPQPQTPVGMRRVKVAHVSEPPAPGMPRRGVFHTMARAGV